MPADFTARPTRQAFSRTRFDEYVVHGNQAAVNPNRTGTKAGALYS